MTQARDGDTVKVHYIGRLEDGTVFDSSEDREPIELRIGAGVIIPGFERAVIGMSPGESRALKVPSDQAYGPYRTDMIGQIDRVRIPAGMQLQVGQRLWIEHPDGRRSQITVTGVSDAAVTIDANHPLAGKDFFFDIELVEIVSAEAA